MQEKHADFTRTCEGCETLFTSTWAKGQECYRCGHDGPCKGYMVGKAGKFNPWVPAWCPKMKNKE